MKISGAQDHFVNYSSKYLLLLLIILILIGLWPFNFFSTNLVRFNSAIGVELERPATAYTSLPGDKLRNISSFSIVVRLKTDSSGLSGFENILGYAVTPQEANFILGQWKDGLGLHLWADGRSQEIHFGDYGLLREGERIVCIISYNGQTLNLYENGKIRKTWKTGPLKFTKWPDSYPLVIGADGNGGSQWQGTLYEIAIYDRAVTESEIEEWSAKEGKGNSNMQQGTGNKSNTGGKNQVSDLELSKEEAGIKPLVHYVFSEANTYETTFRKQKALGVRDLGKGRPADLVIPEYFTPYKREFLEKPPVSLKDYKRNIVEDMVVNLFGFMPLGMLLFMVFERKDLGMGVCLVFAVAVGLSVSLTIELLQAYLPTRNSSMLDLMMNTAGTLIGACAISVKGRMQGRTRASN